MADEKNQHAGHRQRMLKRYLEHGIDGFEDHEILEIFLFTAYSRRNTNDISRALIERFGSLEGVLNAGYDQLKEEKNVGDTAAALITFMKDFARKFSGTDLAGRKLRNSREMCDYFFGLLRDRDKEEAHAAFLDQTMNLITEADVSDIGKHRVDFDLRSIVSRAIKSQCVNIVIAHTHPGGVLLPSSIDVAATRRIFNSLSNIGIQLMDHIIISEEGSYSMRAARMLPDLWDKD